MRWMSVVLPVVALVVGSCATRPGESGPGEFQPTPLNDEWSRWIVGRWQGSTEEDPDRHWEATIQPDLNGQFLVYRSEAAVTELSPEEIRYLKEHSDATDEGIERFRGMPFRELEVHTLDPQTGGVVGYLFDSLRCVAAGKGTRQGNKEVIEWRWSIGGRGTSTRTMERFNTNEAIITEKFTMPDGSITEGKGRMVRQVVQGGVDPNDPAKSL
jgi:hypothetical protein